MAQNNKQETKKNPLRAGDKFKMPTLSHKKIEEINPKIEDDKKQKITDICFNNLKHKTQLASIDVAGFLKIWDVAQGPNGRLIQSFQASKTWLTSVDIEKQEGKKVACGTLDGKLLIFEINSGLKKGKTFGKDKANVEMMGHSGAIQCIQFLSPQYIIAGSTDSLVSVWDLDSPQRYLQIHQQHTGDVLCLHAYEMDSNIFLSGSSDLTCKIWDIRVKKPVQADYKKGHESAVNTVKFLPLSQPSTFVSGSDDATINLWDLRKKEPIAQFQDEQSFDSIYSVAISPSGRYIFAATENKSLKVFDILSENQNQVYPSSKSKNENGGIGQNANQNQNANQAEEGLIKQVDISADGYALAIASGKKGNHNQLDIIT